MITIITMTSSSVTETFDTALITNFLTSANLKAINNYAIIFMLPATTLLTVIQKIKYSNFMNML